MNAQPTIYEIAAETPARGLAEWLRVAIAKAAAADPGWRKTYDRLLDVSRGRQLRHPEMFVTREDDKLGYKAPVLLKDLAGQPDDLLQPLLEEARYLGADDYHAEELDKVAAVVGCEIWFAAVDANELSYAAAKGPDAIASAAALLARACGFGVPVMPADPDWPTLRFPLDRVLDAVRRGRAWSDAVLGVDAWGEVTARVVTDLAFRGGGGTKTHDASLLLGVRMADITT